MNNYAYMSINTNLPLLTNEPDDKVDINIGMYAPQNIPDPQVELVMHYYFNL